MSEGTRAVGVPFRKGERAMRRSPMVFSAGVLVLAASWYFRPAAADAG